MIETAGHFAYQLPEVFAGFSRSETIIPVEYPTPSSPQAWAAGAPLLGLRTLLGLDVFDGALRSSPHLPNAIGRLSLTGVFARGKRWNAP